MTSGLLLSEGIIFDVDPNNYLLLGYNIFPIYIECKIV